MATTPRITLLVASLHILFYLLLSLRVVMHRRANRIGIGTSSGGSNTAARILDKQLGFSGHLPNGN